MMEPPGALPWQLQSKEGGGRGIQNMGEVLTW